MVFSSSTNSTSSHPLQSSQHYRDTAAHQWCDADLDVVPLTGGQLFDAALGRSLESD
jgi:hypothetical protein